jgi:hypothetical protein
MAADKIAEARELYQDALDAVLDQRRQIAEDLAFSDPSNPEQWDETIKRQRETDPGGVRPCYVFDQCGQYVANVAGQVEQNPPALHALPVGNGADKRVAEKLDGFFRHIEHTSRLQQHTARVLTSAARAGVGYYIVRPDYVNRALNWQEPRISSEGDPLRVVLDPWSVELDGSDATFGFLLTPISHREWDRQFKGKEKVSFGSADGQTVRDARESIITAEAWRTVTKTRNMVVFVGQDGDETALEEDEYWEACRRAGVQFPPISTYTDKYSCVKWARMSGVEYLTDETEYPASGIGIVPVYGYVGWSDGRMHYCGIPRRAMNPQRSYNYHMSEMHAFMGQAPKSPWIAAAASIRGYEKLWDRAGVDSRAYLPVNHVDEAGQPIPMPQRMPHAVNLQNHIQGAEQAIRDIQASIGMYQASLGAPSNESSGVAIDARKQQGEAATAHFPAHLSAGLGQVGKLCMEMIPRLIDTKRQVRILSIDQTSSTITIDPEQQGAYQEADAGLVINPNVGRYDVRVVVGASFATQRTQAQAAFTEMMRANPGLAPALAPLWAQTLDVPHADKLAQVLTAVAPPEVRAVLNPESDKQPKVADLMAKVSQLQQGMQEAIQHAQEAQQDADSEKARADEAEDKLAIAAYDAQTKRMTAMKDAISPEQIQQLVVQTLETMLRQPDPQEEMGGEPGPEAWQGQPMPMELLETATPEAMPPMGEEMPALGQPAL